MDLLESESSAFKCWDFRWMLEEDWADIVDPATLGVKMLSGVGIRDQRKKS